MFRKNECHLQVPLISSIDQLPDKVLQRLEASWAATFYREFFMRIDERQFAVLYSTQASRPNTPVNVLFGLECLKVKYSWSDEELYDAFLFDLQVRYALGYRSLGEGQFELRTLYNFRHRLCAYMASTGRNLIDEAFAQITDQQLSACALRTDKLRMDSTLVASNIRDLSRLQLLVEMLQRTYHLLNPADQAAYAQRFAPYLLGSSGQFVYHVTPESRAEHLLAIGLLMQELVGALATDYGQEPAYQLLKRVFGEHFVLAQSGLQVKPAQEIASDSLQAPSDPEATCRTKRGRSYLGYVVNLTETCHPDNPLQLVIDTQTATNITDDGDLLAAALPELVERTDVDELNTDGGYNSERADAALAKYQVVLVQTALRGGQPTEKHLSLAEFAFQPADHGVPTAVTCPMGQTVPVQPTRTRLRARFDVARCQDCVFFGQRCLVDPGRHRKQASFKFDQRDVEVSRRRRRSIQMHASGRNLRPAVEATIRSLKLPFRNDKLPVRGRFRVAMMIVTSAVMINVQRIHRYQRQKNRPPHPAPRSVGSLARFLGGLVDAISAACRGCLPNLHSRTLSA